MTTSSSKLRYELYKDRCKDRVKSCNRKCHLKNKEILKVKRQAKKKLKKEYDDKRLKTIRNIEKDPWFVAVLGWISKCLKPCDS